MAVANVKNPLLRRALLVLAVFSLPCVALFLCAIKALEVFLVEAVEQVRDTWTGFPRAVRNAWDGTPGKNG